MPLASGSRLVLVVEDDELVRRGTTLLLEELGHRTIEAKDAEAALVQLEQYAGIEVMLTDIGLPDMSGIELARIARGRNPTLKVLYASGYDMTAGGAQPVGKADADTGFLSKPFFADEIARELNRLFGPAARETDHSRVRAGQAIVSTTPPSTRSAAAVAAEASVEQT